MINRLAQEIHKNAKDKGFFDTEKNIGEMLCLIHSEVSEALEADRNNCYFNKYNYHAELVAQQPHGKDGEIMAYKTHVKPTFEAELADIMIHVMDLAAFKGIDLEYHILHKMNYNASRPHKHGKAY